MPLKTVHYTCWTPIIVTTSTMTYTHSAFKIFKIYWLFAVCVCVCGRYSKNWMYCFLGSFSLRSHFLIERNKHCPRDSCFHFKACCIRNNSNDIHFAIFDLHIRTSHHNHEMPFIFFSFCSNGNTTYLDSGYIVQVFAVCESIYRMPGSRIHWNFQSHDGAIKMAFSFGFLLGVFSYQAGKPITMQ